MNEAAPAVLLMGPTAAGKTALAMALAERFEVALISVDSTQVYRRLDIGSAKPSAAELARAPHALIDIREPWQCYSVGDFLCDAAGEIRAALGAGKLPLLVGGTMLYFRALQQGLSALPSAAPATRAALAQALAENGLAALRAQLWRVDPVLAARTAEGDTQRTLRALEVWRDSGRPLSAWQADGARPALAPAPLVLALMPSPRALLHARIEQRFDAMLAAGLVDEVAALRALPQLHSELPAMRSVGYRQLWAQLDGRWGGAEARARAIAATRQLAKRQLTWLRRWPGQPLRLNPFDNPDLVEQASAAIERWRASSPLAAPRGQR